MHVCAGTALEVTDDRDRRCTSRSMCEADHRGPMIEAPHRAPDRQARKHAHSAKTSTTLLSVNGCARAWCREVQRGVWCDVSCSPVPRQQDQGSVATPSRCRSSPPAAWTASASARTGQRAREELTVRQWQVATCQGPVYSIALQQHSAHR